MRYAVGVTMDEIDSEILEVLKRNSRTPFTDIAKRLNLTEGAVRYRVKSLVDRGVIERFTIETLEEGLLTVIGARTDPKADLNEVANIILKIRHVEKVFEITGDLDLFILVRGLTHRDLNDAIDAVRLIPGVLSTISYLVLKEYGE